MSPALKLDLMKFPMAFNSLLLVAYGPTCHDILLVTHKTLIPSSNMASRHVSTNRVRSELDRNRSFS